MYLSSARTQREARQRGGGGAASSARVPFNVKMLGTVSLLTDVSSEMLVAVVGYYLLDVLHQSPTAVGFLDGLYNGVPALLAIPAAYLADRYQRRKALAALGYGLSAVTRLGFPVVGPSFGGLTGLLSADRLGKGVRSAPRDALISLSTPEPILGRAFGVHRMMDTVGACAGPLLAAFVLAWTVQFGGEVRAFDALFVISFCVAAMGLVVLWLYVTDHHEPLASRTEVSLSAALRVLREPWFVRTGFAVALLGVAWVSDTFTYLTVAHRLSLGASQYALLATGTMATYLVLAIPVGRLADRVGRWKVFLGGHVLLVVAYLVLAGPIGGVWLLLAALVLPGAAYAATDGVLMAHVSPRIAKPIRTSGIAVTQAIGGASAFASSLVFGMVWSHTGPRTAMVWFAVAVAVAVAASLLLISPWKEEG